MSFNIHVKNERKIKEHDIAFIVKLNRIVRIMWGNTVYNQLEISDFEFPKNGERSNDGVDDPSRL